MHPLWIGLLLALSWWLAVLGGVLASGAFPASARPPALRGPGAMVATAILVASTAALVVLSLLVVVSRVPWSYSIVAAGMGAVLAPPCFTLLPECLVDHPLGSAILAMCCVAAAVAWLWLGGLTADIPGVVFLDTLRTPGGFAPG